MSETLTVPEQKVTEPTNRPQEMTIGAEQLAGAMWGVETPQQTNGSANGQQTTVQPATEINNGTDKTGEQKNEEESKPVDPKEWFKKEFEIEDPEVLKQQLKEYKELKEKTPQEIKWENEQSKKIHELLREGKVDEVVDFYSKQKAIEKVIGAEVNKNTAEDIIKLNLQLKHPSLTKEQIDFQYRQEYGVPREPIQKDTEDEMDFKERHDAWKEQVSNIEMKTLIAATMAKPELESAKAKIVLPEISQPQQTQKQLTQEELDAAKKYDEAYIKSVEDSVKTFNGFSVTVKHEGVDLPISYGVSEEEKTALSQRMKDFSKSNYDANVLFAQRWLKEDGSLNTSQMAKDLSLLDSAEKAFSKIASDASSKTLEAYLKGKKNISVTETFQNKTTEITKEDKTEFDLVRDSFFG